MAFQIHWVGRFELTGIACEIYFYSMLNGFVMSHDSFTPSVKLAIITKVCFEFSQMLLVHVISHGICRYFFVHGIVYAQMVNDLDIRTTPSCFFLPSEHSVWTCILAKIAFGEKRHSVFCTCALQALLFLCMNTLICHMKVHFVFSWFVVSGKVIQERVLVTGKNLVKLWHISTLFT